MNTFLATALYKILSVLVSLVLFLSPLSAPAPDDPIRRGDGVRLSAALWSDTHMSDYLFSRVKHVKSSVMDLAAAEGLDALVIDGDITENGKPQEFRLMADELAKLSNVGHIIPASGNHDIRLRNFNMTVKTFSEFCETVNPAIRTDKLYYSYEVNGYTFIVLGSTETVFEEAAVSDGELAFLDASLAAATADGKPAFVLLHQPLRNTHNLPDAWGSPIPSAGSVGRDSDRLIYVMNKYENVFLITGHLHSGLGVNNFEDVGKLHSVNLPSIGIVSKDGGYEAAGTGYVMSVTDDSVTFRARDFANGRYLPEYDHSYTLVK